MKTYDEREALVAQKVKKLRTRNKVIKVACWTVGVIALVLVLFLPYQNPIPDVSVYQGSEYYDILKNIALAGHQEPKFKNNYQKLLAGMTGWMWDGGGTLGPEDNVNSNAGYVEVTDNQVAGVLESDIVKRTDTHIFHLREESLVAYSIDGAQSREVGVYSLKSTESYSFESWPGWQMYLSPDGNTVSVVAYCTFIGKTKQEMTVIRNLDVSDPENIQEAGSFFLSGRMLTTRMIGGDLLVLTRDYVSSFGLNKDDKTTFLPQMGTLNHMETFPAEAISCSDRPSRYFTNILRLDVETLEPISCEALLFDPQEAYVSENGTFVINQYVQTQDTAIGEKYTFMSEIACVDYGGQAMQYRGAVAMDGTVENQYSMDEHEGILRVVTSTNSYVRFGYGDYAENVDWLTKRNANLYCVDLSTMEIAAKVEGFAPEGEKVYSARFDGSAAYVCTAEIVKAGDPVYFFDLSDLSNITWKDTGTIDGYSSSLVNFVEGYLLGIGFGGTGGLKIEVYAETDTGVESVAAYEEDAFFSTEYKSYLIDRERKIIGLGIRRYDEEQRHYILLQFADGQLKLMKDVPLDGEVNLMRGILIEDYLYLIEKEFKVEPLF